MIVSRGNGKWQVMGESNRPLSKPDLTRKEAEARLAEVERFKSVGKDVEALKRWASAKGKKR